MLGNNLLFCEAGPWPAFFVYQPYRITILPLRFPITDRNAAARLKPELSGSSVRSHEFQYRTEKYDGDWIDRLMALIIVPLDVVHVDGLGNSGDAIELAQVAGQVRILGDPLQIALEVTVVNCVEA